MLAIFFLLKSALLRNSANKTEGANSAG